MLEVTSEDPQLNYSYSFSENILFAEFVGNITSSLFGKLLEKLAWYNKIYQPDTFCIHLAKAVFRIDFFESKNYIKRFDFSETENISSVVMIFPEEIFSRMIFNRLSTEINEDLKDKIRPVHYINNYNEAISWLQQKQQIISSDQSTVSYKLKTSLT